MPSPLPLTGDLTRRGDFGVVALPLVGLRIGESGLLPTTPSDLGEVGGRFVLIGEIALFRCGGGDMFLLRGDIPPRVEKGDFDRAREMGLVGDLDLERLLLRGTGDLIRGCLCFTDESPEVFVLLLEEDTFSFFLVTLRIVLLGLPTLLLTALTFFDPTESAVSGLEEMALPLPMLLRRLDGLRDPVPASPNLIDWEAID